ncbi:MAG: hypothetical protein ACQESE_01515, partial [Nanobdellota archaeon]
PCKGIFGEVVADKKNLTTPYQPLTATTQEKIVRTVCPEVPQSHFVGKNAPVGDCANTMYVKAQTTPIFDSSEGIL